MSKNPANRYQSAADMRNDLLRALAGQRVEATPVMGDAEKTAILGAPARRLRLRRRRRLGRRGRGRPARRKRRIIAIVAVLAVLLLGGAIAAAIALSGDDDARRADRAGRRARRWPARPQAAAERRSTDAGLRSAR